MREMEENEVQQQGNAAEGTCFEGHVLDDWEC